MATGTNPDRAALAAAWAVQQLGADAWNNYCEQFVEQAYGRLGAFRSAVAAGNALLTPQSAQQARRALAGAQVGDLVYFQADDSNQNYGHAGIYVGNGKMVSATPSGVKETGILDDPYYGPRFRGVATAPQEWSGRPSTPQLQAGAQQLIAAAQQGLTKGTNMAGDQPQGQQAGPLVSQLTQQASEVADRLKTAQDKLAAAQNDTRYTGLRPGFTADDAQMKLLNDAVDRAQKEVDAAQKDYDTVRLKLAEAQQSGGQSGAQLTAQDKAAAGYYDAMAQRALAGVGLDQAQTAQAAAKLAPELAQLAAQTASSNANAQSTLATLQPTIARLQAETGLSDAQAQALLAKLPSELAQAQAQTGLAQAQTRNVGAEADMNAAKLAALQQAQQELDAAYQLPPGPDRQTALQSALEKYGSLTDPAAALSYSTAEANRRLQAAAELSKQTGYQIDLTTMAPKMGPDGQPLPTQEAQQAQRAYELQRQQLESQQGIAAINTASSIAQQQAQMLAEHQQRFLPAQAAQALNPIFQSFATGKMPAALNPQDFVMPAREQPADAYQRIFQSVMTTLAPHSPMARQLLEAQSPPSGAPASVPAAPPPPPPGGGGTPPAPTSAGPGEQPPMPALLARYGFRAPPPVVPPGQTTPNFMQPGV